MTTYITLASVEARLLFPPLWGEKVINLSCLMRPCGRLQVLDYHKKVRKVRFLGKKPKLFSGNRHR
jgi:hypothetical protein